MEQTVSEITVTIKGEDKTLREKFLIYEAYQVKEDDPVIKDCISRTIKDFITEPSDIRVKISLQVL